MRADGSRKRIIRRTGARFEYDATFSPDGGSILFIRGERIYLMRRDGRSAHPCTAMSSSRRARASPATGGRSPWRGRAGKSGAYFVMNADGTRPSAHQRGQRFDWGCPSWFPDGKPARIRQGLQPPCRLGGRHEHRANHRRQRWHALRPSVSPDGRSIACDGFANRYGYGIIVMRAEGTAIRRITRGSGEIENDAGASWSPDGRQIAFSGYRGRFKGAGVYVVDRDGSGLRRLSNVARLGWSR